jgi:FkbM family methyltransferase
LHTKTIVKAVRRSRPLNYLATSSVRSLMRLSGRESDFVVRHLPRSGTVDVALPDGRRAKFWSQGDDYIANRLFWRGWQAHEPEATALWYSLASEASVTLDIGAHIGFHSVFAGLANPEGVVYALEPLPRVFDRLRRNLTINDLLDRVRPLRVAAGREAGTSDLWYVGGATVPSSSSLSRSFMAPLGGNVAIPVEVIAVDALVEQERIGRVDLVKIDTEATETDVLAGMATVLERDRPAILCEVLPAGDAEALMELLEPLGYSFALLTDRGPVARRRIVPDNRWTNYLFTTRDLPVGP